MFSRFSKYLLVLAIFACTTLQPQVAFAQSIDIDIYVRSADGSPIEVTAVVTLIATTGQILSQGTTLGGNITFSGIAASHYTIQVVAPGYENKVQEFDSYNV